MYFASKYIIQDETLYVPFIDMDSETKQYLYGDGVECIGAYVPKGDVEFIAQWAKAYVVTWDGGDGYADGAEEDGVIYNGVKKYVTNVECGDGIYGYMPAPKRLGYEVSGYKIGDKVYTENELMDYVPTGDITVYIQWKKIEEKQNDPTPTPTPSGSNPTLSGTTPTSAPTPGQNVKPSTPPASADDVKAPVKAKIKSAKNVKGKKITVNWNKVSGAKGYEVQYALDNKFTKSVKTKTATFKANKKPTYIIKKLKKKKTYFVRVRAYKLNSQKEKVYGAWSKAKRVKVKK